MLLGKARGRVGNLVFYDNKGQQVVRAYQPRMPNPRTQAQQTNRVIMNTVTQAWKFLKPFVLYEGHAKSEFRSLFFKWNIAHIRHRLAQLQNPMGAVDFTPLSENNFTYNEWEVTRGTINQPEFYWDDFCVLFLGEWVDFSEGATYEDLANYLGVGRGACINVILWYLTSQVGGDGTLECDKIRIVLDPYIDGLPASFQTVMADQNDQLVAPNPNNIFNKEKWTLSLYDRHMIIAHISDLPVVAAIISICDNDRATNQVFTVNSDNNPGFAPIDYTNVHTLQQALAKIEPDIRGSELYLNNASD